MPQKNLPKEAARISKSCRRYERADVSWHMAPKGIRMEGRRVVEIME